jgi:hypothetical protein
MVLCALVAAQAPFHDIDQLSSGDGPGEHQGPPHDHPAVSVGQLSAFAVLAVVIAASCISCRQAIPESASLPLPTRTARSVRCDNDIGLYTLLSSFRI